MSSAKCCSFCPCNIAFFLILLLMLCGSLASGALSLFSELGDLVSVPKAAWVPLSIAAVSGTVWGLWLGFRQHGRAEPLAVGILGLVASLIGFVVWQPIALLGTATVLGAAIWGAFAFGLRR